MVEPKENKYDYSIVNSILQFVNKYNLKMELLWFSTNMVGDSFSYLIPQYVLQEYNKRLSRNDEGNFWNYYGYQYTMILDDEWILERETKAITALFNHIRYWDSQNGDKHPVISAQIHNEPDALMRWRIDQKDLKYRDGPPLSKEKAWTMITNALNTVGKAVKNSSYRVVTRVNLIYGDGINHFQRLLMLAPKMYSIFKALISLALMLIKIMLNISKMKSWHTHQLQEIMRWLPRTKVVMQTVRVLS